MSGELDAGEWFEYNETTPGVDVESIRGVSVWRTNKPCGLMQYAYSAGWDQSAIFDPFMIWIPPVEVMSKRLTFQTPENASFVNNYAQFIVVGDSLDNASEKLKSVKVDNEFLFEMDPNLLNSRVPGTNYYHASVRLEPGSHSVRSNTRFSCTMYGFATWESYGWFSAPIEFVGESDDTTPPTVDIEVGDSTAMVVVSDNDGSPNFSGLYWIELNEQECENLHAETYFWFGDGSRIAATELEFVPVSAEQDVIVVGVVEDLAGNTTAFRDTIPSLAFYRPAVSLDLNGLVEPSLLIGEQLQQTILVNNVGNGSLFIDSLVSTNGSAAFVFEGSAHVIPVNESLEVPITFVGELNAEFAHRDTLLVYTNAQTEPLEIPVACSVLPLRNPELVDLSGIFETNFGPDFSYGMQVESGGLAVSIDSIAVPTSYANFSGNSTPLTVNESSTYMLSFYLTFDAVDFTFADVELYCSVDGIPYPEPLQTRISWYAVIGSVQDGIASQAHVHPQPSVDNIHIELEEEVHGQAQVDVYDYNGRRVLTQQRQVIGGALFVPHQLPTGTYSLRVIVGDQLFSSKLSVK